MKQLFSLDGVVYQWLLALYNLLKLNIVCIVGLLTIVFGFSSFSTVLALLVQHDIKLAEISMRDVRNTLKKHLKVPVAIQIMMMLYAVLAYFVVTIIPLSIYFFLVTIVGFLICYFNYVLVKQDERFHLHHTASAIYLTMKYIGFFCIGLVPLCITWLVPIYFPAVIILWVAFGLSAPLWLFASIYDLIVKREIRMKSQES